MTDITPIIQSLITLMVALVTVFVVPWVKKKIGAENMDEFLSWVDIGVAAAEQLFSSDEAFAKKQYVLNFLTEKGYSVNEIDVNNAIEAAVLRLHAELYGAEQEAVDGEV